MKRDEIIKLKTQNPEMSYRQIAKLVKCSHVYVAKVLKGIKKESKNKEDIIKEIEEKIKNNPEITEEEIADRYGLTLKEAVKIYYEVKNRIEKEKEGKRILIEKHLKRIQKKEDEEIARQNLIYELLSQSVQRFEPPIINYQKPKKFMKKNLTAIACFSDWHIGEIVLPEHVNGINVFNEQIAAARIELLVEKIIEITQLQRTHSNVDKIVVWLGGDMVSGVSLCIDKYL